MTDFASGSMGRVLVEGMRMLGMEQPRNMTTQQTGRATIPLDLKRLLIQRAMEQGGEACLVRLGQGLKRFAHEPAHRALCSAGSPQELLRRWQKLERYTHSRHRTEVIPVSAESLMICHFALPDHPSPLPAEDLVILGVLTALMEVIGAQHVKAKIDGVEVYPQCDARALAQLTQSHATSQWELIWQSMVTRPTSDAAVRANGHLQGTESWSDLARLIYSDLAVNPMADIPVAVRARNAGTTTRGLQRALKTEGLTYSLLVSAARASVAGKDLLDTRDSIAGIGFSCGYSDQAHFTREFRKVVGLTPAKFRESFTSPTNASFKSRTRPS